MRSSTKSSKRSPPSMAANSPTLALMVMRDLMASLETLMTGRTSMTNSRRLNLVISKESWKKPTTTSTSWRRTMVTLRMKTKDSRKKSKRFWVAMKILPMLLLRTLSSRRRSMISATTTTTLSSNSLMPRDTLVPFWKTMTSLKEVLTSSMMKTKSSRRNSRDSEIKFQAINKSNPEKVLPVKLMLSSPTKMRSKSTRLVWVLVLLMMTRSETWLNKLPSLEVISKLPKTMSGTEMRRSAA
mmetsp:Transcript_15439/g.13167  ORF Transcript_15439/g.13167 Transcript_15439/m.13167 type:complete len:241 (+) Transcript_15439:376-1098(+)